MNQTPVLSEPPIPIMKLMDCD